MACLKKLDSDITFDCANLGISGGIGEIDEAIIINSSDLSTVADNGTGWATVTMQTGKKGFLVNSVNNSIMYQDAIKVNDTTPPGEDQSVVIKILNNGFGFAADSPRRVVSQLLGGNFRVAFKSKTGLYFFAGAFCGLEASDLATDSSTGGVSTITLKTPEAATGDVLLRIAKGDYDGLKIPKV